MVGSDYIHGNEKRELAPQDNITRAEFAQIFHNIIQEYLLTSGTYTQDYTGNLLIRTDDVTLRDLTVDGDLIIGCGAADGTITLDNVTVTGRVVVWGGGTQAVYMNNGTDVEDLIVCRVDGPVKVIFDRDSTLAVYQDIAVTVTDRAEAFPATEVIFYDISDILEEQDKVATSIRKGRSRGPLASCSSTVRSRLSLRAKGSTAFRRQIGRRVSICPGCPRRPGRRTGRTRRRTRPPPFSRSSRPSRSGGGGAPCGRSACRGSA